MKLFLPIDIILEGREKEEEKTEVEEMVSHLLKLQYVFFAYHSP